MPRRASVGAVSLARLHAIPAETPNSAGRYCLRSALNKSSAPEPRIRGDARSIPKLADEVAIRAHHSRDGVAALEGKLSGRLARIGLLLLVQVPWQHIA